MTTTTRFVPYYCPTAGNGGWVRAGQEICPKCGRYMRLDGSGTNRESMSCTGRRMEAVNRSRRMKALFDSEMLDEILAGEVD